MIWGSTTGRVKRSLLQNVQTVTGIYPASYSMGKGGAPFLGLKCLWSQDRRRHHHPPPCAYIDNGRNSISTPLICLNGVRRDNFAFIDGMKLRIGVMSSSRVRMWMQSLVWTWLVPESRLTDSCIRLWSLCDLNCYKIMNCSAWNEFCIGESLALRACPSVALCLTLTLLGEEVHALTSRLRCSDVIGANSEEFEPRKISRVWRVGENRECH